MNPNQRKHRKQEIARRAKTPNHDARYCAVVECKRPPRAATGDGLNLRYCRVHSDHHGRHGSVFRGSYTRGQLNPYRRAAYEWLTEHADDRWVKLAHGRVLDLYQKAGPVVEAFRLRGKDPEERARAAWARLRKAEVDPRLPLSAWLAVEMITRDDPQAIRKIEYRRVQAAKVIHAIVSGSHKSWEQVRPNGQIAVEKLDKYPASRGRVLRHIGKDIGGAAEMVVEKHLANIAAFKARREEEGKLAKRPHPGRTRAAMQPAPPPTTGASQDGRYTFKLPDGTVIKYG